MLSCHFVFVAVVINTNSTLPSSGWQQKAAQLAEYSQFPQTIVAKQQYVRAKFNLFNFNNVLKKPL